MEVFLSKYSFTKAIFCFKGGTLRKMTCLFNTPNYYRRNLSNLLPNSAAHISFFLLNSKTPFYWSKLEFDEFDLWLLYFFTLGRLKRLLKRIICNISCLSCWPSSNFTRKATRIHPWISSGTVNFPVIIVTVICNLCRYVCTPPPK